MQTQRKYALTKVGKGDWLLPSNDGRTIWRIAQYEDGPSHGLIDWPRDERVWGVWKWTGHGDAVDPDEWADWEMWIGTLTTRATAIEEALSVA